MALGPRIPPFARDGCLDVFSVKRCATAAAFCLSSRSSATISFSCLHRPPDLHVALWGNQSSLGLACDTTMAIQRIQSCLFQSYSCIQPGLSERRIGRIASLICRAPSTQSASLTQSSGAHPPIIATLRHRMFHWKTHCMTMVQSS